MKVIKIDLSRGDVPALEVEHKWKEEKALLKIYDDKGEILVQAQLNHDERYKLMEALTSVP